MAIAKRLLSGSTDGKSVLIAATASTGTTVHTGPSTSTDMDEVWLYASNIDSAAHTLTIQWGGTATQDAITLTIPAYQGLVVVAPGLPLNGNATPLVIRAYADTTNKVTLFGYVNRITQ